MGSIPKSLAWINSSESEPIVQDILEKTEPKKLKQKSPVVIENQLDPSHETIKNKKSNQEEIHAVSESTTSMNGLAIGWTRATFIVKQEINEKLKALAYWERLTVKEVVHEALSAYLQDKQIRAMPKKKEII